MRIRKRFQSSDLQLHPTAAAQHSDQQSDSQKQPSDPNMAISYKKSRWVHPKNNICEEKKKLKELERDEPQREEVKKSNDIKNVSDDDKGAKLILQSSSSSGQGRWCEGDYEVVLLKKRKGNFKTNADQEKKNAKMKFKTEEKCVQHNGETMHMKRKTAREEHYGMNNFLGGAKKSKRGTEIMEGSRCSRVNGRGWRCFQQTLVGYSLCEHHLGKGRVRSMTGGRLHTMSAGGGPLPNAHGAPPSRDEDSGKNAPLTIKKKRTKVGAVKARSIRSLLSQI